MSDATPPNPPNPAEPIFTPEPPPATPMKKRWSTGAKVALGCGLLALAGVGTCAGGMMWCGHAITSAGGAEWADLRKVANDLMTDSGAQAEYASHPGLAEAYPTADDFVGAVRLWRPNLEPLPEQMPPLLSGKVSLNINSMNGESRTQLAYRLASGKSLVATWKNHQLADLQLE